MKLELSHLAPYLPYELQIDAIKRYEGIRTMVCTENSSENVTIDAVLRLQYRPILRPLSDLTKEIECNSKNFVAFDKIKNNHIDFFADTDFEDYILDRYNKSGFWATVIFLPSGLVELLLEWHFDVFGLIEKGLAIDINTFLK